MISFQEISTGNAIASVRTANAAAFKLKKHERPSGKFVFLLTSTEKFGRTLFPHSIVAAVQQFLEEHLLPFPPPLLIPFVPQAPYPSSFTSYQLKKIAQKMQM